MKIYDLTDKSGQLIAFEITNCGRRRACNVAKTIPGAIVVRRPRFFEWSSPDEFCEFRLGARTFVIMEPFGDNSRFWVGPTPPEPCQELQIVRSVFESR